MKNSGPTTVSGKLALTGVIITALTALAGAGIGGYFTAANAQVAAESQKALQEEQFDEEKKRLLRDQRAPYYAAYDAAVQTFATQMTVRNECEKKKLATCRYSVEDLQTARYELQGAINNIYIYGSIEMQAAVTLMSATMPRTMVGLSGYAEAGPVDAPAFLEALNKVRAVTCYDVSPVHDSCPRLDSPWPSF